MLMTMLMVQTTLLLSRYTSSSSSPSLTTISRFGLLLLRSRPSQQLLLRYYRPPLSVSSVSTSTTTSSTAAFPSSRSTSTNQFFHPSTTDTTTSSPLLLFDQESAISRSGRGLSISTVTSSSTTTASAELSVTSSDIGHTDWYSNRNNRGRATTNIKDNSRRKRRKKNKKTITTTSSSRSTRTRPTTRPTRIMPSKSRNKIYAVAIGRKPGIYHTWAECEEQVKGFSSARYKSFHTQEEAQLFIVQHQQLARTLMMMGSTTFSSTPDNNHDHTNAATTTVPSYLQRTPLPVVGVASQNPHHRHSNLAVPFGQTTSVQRSSTSDSDDQKEIPKKKKAKQDTTTATSSSISDLQEGSQQSSSPSTSSSEPTTHGRIPNRLWFHINFDGGSRGNPHGDSGSGTLIVTRSFYDTSDASKTITSSLSVQGQQATTTAGRRRSTTGSNKNKTIVGRTKTKIRTYLGLGKTNNQAEYTGAIRGLEYVVGVLQSHTENVANKKTNNIDVTIVLQGDSDLVIRQLKGLYKCNSPKLKSLLQTARGLVTDIERLSKSLDITYEHVYRSDNSEADALANEAMDAQRSWTTTSSSSNVRRTTSTSAFKDGDGTKRDDDDDDDDSDGDQNDTISV